MKKQGSGCFYLANQLGIIPSLKEAVIGVDGWGKRDVGGWGRTAVNGEGTAVVGGCAEQQLILEVKE